METKSLKPKRVNLSVFLWRWLAWGNERIIKSDSDTPSYRLINQGDLQIGWSLKIRRNNSQSLRMPYLQMPCLWPKRVQRVQSDILQPVYKPDNGRESEYLLVSQMPKKSL